jgi:hypothetical protein
MDIWRKGALRDRGTKKIISELSFKTDGKHWWENNVRWDSTHKELDIHARLVQHTDGLTHHNYTISLTLEDVSALIAVFGHAASATDAGLLRDHLAKDIPAIVKLLACATGIAPNPLEGK